MGSRIDLHTHTVASDGALAPDALVALAAARGVGTLAITDHDTAAALPAASAAAARAGLRLIGGVELSTDGAGGEVHVLGYFVDVADMAFAAALERLREARVARARGMVAKLNELGASVRYEDIARHAQGVVGRPHVARALVESGFVRTVSEAFQRYIGYGRPAYVERERLTPEGAVRELRDAGAVPVFAHPIWGGTPERIETMVEAGLLGIEAYYPEHSPADVVRFREAARSYGLVTTGGTDYHGGGVGGDLVVGGQYVPADTVERLDEARRRLAPRSGAASAADREGDSKHG
ncbi:MAG: PHP domain-containing protein [Armatimonadetes bacterium]|nr:PHP domain-containing protein [Armatimonadota bacterium]